MDRLKAVIVDDEKPALHLLSQKIGERNDVHIVGAFTNPAEVLNAISTLLPDVVFLDIEMPGMSGLELASCLLETQDDIEIVFVTAFRQYAIEAFRVNAIDYLLKPVDSGMLDETVERLKRRRSKTQKDAAVAVPRMNCFGSFAVFRCAGAEPLHFPTAKTEELLAYLLVHRGTNISKWTLCENLWPDCEPEKAEQNLHTTIYRMKKTLKDGGVNIRIFSQRGFYRFEYDGTCDYIEFEHLLSGQRELHSENFVTLERMVRLYKGSLFGNKDYRWCEAERERMFRGFSGMAKNLAKGYMDEGELGRAEDVLKYLLAEVPLDEQAHELLLTVYLRLKDRVSFLHHYEKMGNLLRLELGIDPRPEIQQLMRSLNQ